MTKALSALAMLAEGEEPRRALLFPFVSGAEPLLLLTFGASAARPLRAALQGSAAGERVVEIELAPLVRLFPGWQRYAAYVRSLVSTLLRDNFACTDKENTRRRVPYRGGG